MKKTIAIVAGLVCFAFSGRTQTLSGPESVERNSSDLSYFVSNTGTGEIVKLLPDGTVQSFASGFTAGPHGLELIGDSLYACDGSYIRIVNRTTGAIVNSVSIGGSFLNGITHKDHNLYFTDFSAKKIYRMNTKNNQFNVFVTGLTKTPNGILYDDLNDRLVFVCWGSSAPIYEVDLYDSTTTLLTTTTYGNCDGIAMNCSGDYFVSCWSPSSNLIKFNPTFSSGTSLGLSGLSSPADIYFDKLTDTLAIPNSGNNTVTKSQQASCILSIEDNNPNYTVNVFPNPTQGLFNLNSSVEIASIEIRNITGQLIYSNTGFGTTQFNLGGFPSGVYYVKAIATNQAIVTIPLLKTE